MKHSGPMHDYMGQNRGDWIASQQICHSHDRITD